MGCLQCVELDAAALERYNLVPACLPLSVRTPPAVSGEGGDACMGDTLPSLSLVVEDGGVGGREKPEPLDSTLMLSLGITIRPC